jgi:tetratricopeptide (TPR) repeat protein
VSWLYPVAAVVVFAVWPLVRGSLPEWGILVYVAIYVAGALSGVLVVLLLRRLQRRRARPGVSTAGALSSAVAQPEEHRAFLTPLELPPPPRHFVGRTAEIAQIVDYLRSPAADGPRTVVIPGPPGIGKSALAVRVAHQVVDDYADGVLYAAFHGAPGDLENVSGDLVSALLGQGDRVPDAVPARLELFRELTRHRRVLVVLDGVDESAYVGQLLPAGPGCAALVTSRVPQLQLQPGQLRLPPPRPLPETDAVSLLGAIVGQDRVSQQETAARQIVRALGGHPLAVQLAGALLAGRPFLDLRIPVKRIRLGAGSVLARGRPFTGSLDMIYVLLTAEEQRAVRLMPLLAAQTFAPWMLAALLDVPQGTAWRIADRLVAAGLVERSRDDTSGVPEFRVLDHVWAYVRARPDAGDDDADAPLRLRRVLERRSELRPEHLLRSEAYVLAGRGALSPALNRARDALALAREHDPDSAGLALAALAELTLELGGLDEAEELAGEAGKSRDVDGRVRALRCLGGVERRRRQLPAAAGHIQEGLELVPARDSGERTRLLCELAVIHALDRRYEDGRSAAEAAALVCRGRRDGGRRHLAGVLYARGTVEYHSGELAAARTYLGEAAELARQQDLPLSEGWIDHALGLVAVAGGDPDEAVQATSRALDKFSGLLHRYGTAHCRVLLARAELERHLPEAAVALLEDGLDAFHKCGDRWVEADTSLLLAEVQHSLCRDDQARAAARVAVRLFDGLGDHDRAAEARALLARTDVADESAATPAGS